MLLVLAAGQREWDFWDIGNIGTHFFLKRVLKYLELWGKLESAALKTCAEIFVVAWNIWNNRNSFLFKGKKKGS